ncbi:MAG: hypothetical protein KAS32_15735 [Candidatus Peribacteraceae bacterium]|nr:hypothetical protein [Candidatus Peribacteraceae bacterium]
MTESDRFNDYMGVQEDSIEVLELKSEIRRLTAIINGLLKTMNDREIVEEGVRE